MAKEIIDKIWRIIITMLKMKLGINRRTYSETKIKWFKKQFLLSSICFIHLKSKIKLGTFPEMHSQINFLLSFPTLFHSSISFSVLSPTLIKTSFIANQLLNKINFWSITQSYQRNSLRTFYGHFPDICGLSDILRTLYGHFPDIIRTFPGHFRTLSYGHFRTPDILRTFSGHYTDISRTFTDFKNSDLIQIWIRSDSDLICFIGYIHAIISFCLNHENIMLME